MAGVMARGAGNRRPESRRSLTTNTDAEAIQQHAKPVEPVQHEFKRLMELQLLHLIHERHGLLQLLLNVKPEQEKIAVLGYVVAAFLAHFTGFLGALFAVTGDKIIVGDGFGLDEAFLEIRVDDTGGLRCF